MVILVESRTKWKLEVRSLVLGKDSGVWRLVETTVRRYSQRGWRVDSRDQR